MSIKAPATTACSHDPLSFDWHQSTDKISKQFWNGREFIEAKIEKNNCPRLQITCVGTMPPLYLSRFRFQPWHIILGHSRRNSYS
jgi:hypothetical protein